MDSQQDWLEQFQPQDLARAVIRQYFVQNKLLESLKSFEKEDSNNGKKITKSVLIKMLSMTTLFQQNKSVERPFKSLLEILCNYLKGKFRQKVEKTKCKQSQTVNATAIIQQESPKKLTKENGQTAKNKDYTSSESVLSDRQPQRLLAGIAIQEKKIAEVDTSSSNLRQHSFDKKSDQLSMLEDKRKTQQLRLLQQQQLKKRKKIETLDNELKKSNDVDDKTDRDSRVTGMRKMGKRNTQSSHNDQKEENLKADTESLSNRNKAYNVPEEFKQSSQLQNQQKEGKGTKRDRPVTANKRTQSKQQRQREKQPEQPPKSPKNMIEVGKKSSQKQEQGKKMVTMFGKKKLAAQSQLQATNQTKKFQFDENFVDQPLHVRQNYNYQKFSLARMTIKQSQEPQINYKQRLSSSTSINKKKTDKPLTEQEAAILKKIIFQNGSHLLPKSWHQGFILSPFPSTPFGLKQIEGGPCGIIAAVQCYYLKHLLYLSKPEKQQDLSNEIRRQICLVAAITDILMKVKSGDKLYLTLPPRSFAGNKLDINHMTLSTVDADNFRSAFEGVWNNRSSFIGQSNHGVTVLMYSIVMTKGPQNIANQIDCPENPLIGHHGHCTQQLVNLFITGKAISNCFDGEKLIDDDYKIKGISEKAQFGFLTIFETLKYIEVGKNLKKPVFPFWVICKEFHYHVIFGNHYLIGENDDAQKFDMVYYDGLYNCGDKIVLTLQKYPFGEEPQIKLKQLPLIEQVMMTKWGPRKVNWNGSIKIL